MEFEKLYTLSNDYENLFDISIDSSCNIDNYKFWFCKRSNKYYLVWCKILRQKPLTNLLIAYQQKANTLLELEKDDGFIKYFKSKITYNEVTLNNKQSQMFEKFYNFELNDNIYKPHGLDGFSYYITYYKNNEIIKRNCWCEIPYQWNILNQILKEIFTIAGIDKIILKKVNY